MNGATNYELLEANNSAFNNSAAYYPIGTSMNVIKNVATESGRWYYKVRTNFRYDNADHYSTYSNTISANVNSQ